MADDTDYSILTTMQPISTGEDVDDEDTAGTICGIDVRPHLGNPGPSTEPDEQEQAMNRFMRNEVDYDGFMRLTGGQTLAEELDEAPDETLDDDDEYQEEERGKRPLEDDDSDELQMTFETRKSADAVPKKKKRVDPEYAREALEAQNMLVAPTKTLETLPPFVQALMNEMYLDAAALPPPVVETLASKMADLVSNVKVETNEGASEQRERKRDNDRKKTKTMDALLGQANVIYARGNVEEALQMFFEVVRQDPRNTEAYRQMSMIYQHVGETQLGLQYGLLACHLDSRTPCDEWMQWGDEARKLHLHEEAAACYSRALRQDPKNWRCYEKRIEMLDLLGLRPLAMRTRLQAAQQIDYKDANVDFEWFNQLIRTLASYYITINDEEKAILALEAFVLRSREFEMNIQPQYDTLIALWMSRRKYMEAATSILAVCDDIEVTRTSDDQPAFTVSIANGSYHLTPFPPMFPVKFEVDEKMSIHLHAQLIICFMHLNRSDLGRSLTDILLTRDLSEHEFEPSILDVARCFEAVNKLKWEKKFLEDIGKWVNFSENSADYWFIFGNFHLMHADNKKAMKCFDKVLELKPSHVDSRIKLSTLQQNAGLAEKAFETLCGHDLDQCTSLPDERLLMRQADVLLERRDMDQFVRTARLMLAPHFFEVHRVHDAYKNRPARNTGLQMTTTLRVAALNAIANSNWEKLVRRLGANALIVGRPLDQMTVSTMHDYCLRMIEYLIDEKRYNDALIVCCYALLQPRLVKSERVRNFQSITYFCAIKARSWVLAFEYVRWYYSIVNSSVSVNLPNDRGLLMKRLFNAMNYVFVNSQNVCYHRYIMRSLAKARSNNALHTISGNNSLITGTYRHALGEYLRVWNTNRNNPLTNLMLGLTFTHMACKKDLSSRHLIALRGVAFMKNYAKARTVTAEVHYNIGRMFHQMNILPIAKHFYEKVLYEDEPPMVCYTDAEGNYNRKRLKRYDLRRMAAHNLAYLYNKSGNDFAAREIYEKFLVV